MKREPYPSGMTNKQWTLLEPLSPAAKSGGYLRSVDMRQVPNAIFYVQS